MYNITIIIPVYNAEKYLKELLESIVYQTMDFKTIQVIMVDDHSKDNSTKIMDEYANKYDNFVSIKLEKNHKIAGTSRNEGLKRAEGKYIMFADADDFFMEDACEIMFNTIEKIQDEKSTLCSDMCRDDCGHDFMRGYCRQW